MRNILIRSALILTGLFTTSAAFAASISSTFDSGDQGWTVGDIDGLTDGGGFQLKAPVYNPTGGNPGGYISTTDDFNITGFFAPGAYTGNKSSYYGGAISFDLQDQEAADKGAGAYPALFLYGDGKVIAIAGGAPATTFTHFSFNLTETGFDYYTGGGESPGTTPVTAADFKAVIGNLTEVAIQADWHTGGDLTGLDNVLVSAPSPVPLPASAPMFGAALMALGAVGYGMKRKARTA